MEHDVWVGSVWIIISDIYDWYLWEIKGDGF